MKINRAELLLGLIISLGIGLRTVNLNGQPVSIYWDEAAMAYDAFSLTQTGQDMHGHSLWQAIFPSYGDYKLPLYIWLAAVMMKILGPTVTAFRLVSALSGSVLIGLSYLLAKEVFKSKAAGLASAVVIAFSPWAIHFSRVGFEANLAVTCLTGAVWLLFRARQKPAYLMGAAGLMGLSLYAYFSARFVGPLITLSFLLLYGRQLPRRFWSWLGAAGLVFFLIFWPIYRSEYGQVSQQFRLSTESLWNTNDHILDQNRYRELAGNHWLARLVYHRWWFLSRRLMVNLSAFFDWRYLFFTGDPNLRHGTGRVGLFLMPLIAFLGAGIIRGLKRHSRAVIFLLSWWLIAVIPAAIPLTVPHALRSLNALPAVAGLIGYGIASWLTSRRQIFRLIGIGLLVSSGLWFFYYWHDYWHHYPARSAAAWQYGYEAAARYLGGDQFQAKSIQVEVLDRLYLYFLWFNRIDPTLVQNQTTNFQISQFERFRFVPINQETVAGMKPGTVIMIRADEPVSLTGWRLLETINDYQTLPLYQIYEKNS